MRAKRPRLSLITWNVSHRAYTVRDVNFREKLKNLLYKLSKVSLLFSRAHFVWNPLCLWLLSTTTPVWSVTLLVYGLKMSRNGPVKFAWENCKTTPDPTKIFLWYVYELMHITNLCDLFFISFLYPMVFNYDLMKEISFAYNYCIFWV